MNQDLWERLKPLYDAAVDLDAAARARFVDACCGGDEQLRSELLVLLAGSDSGTSPLDHPLVHVPELFPAVAPALLAGDLVLNRFKVVRMLGSGGMGEVYEALDLDMGSRRIALKTIRASIAATPEILARFKEEVYYAQQVSGTGVCRIHHLFLPPAGTHNKCAAFLTMEYLEGTTLADRIIEQKRLSVEQATQVARQLCTALQTIHDAGVIHRDLKPRNIMLVPRRGSEQVVVMDFGLARASSMTAPSDETRHTVPGLIVGTPDYMAPEQFEGGAVSPATDIYALGIVLYEMVSGSRPFSAVTPQGGLARRRKPVTMPVALHPGLPSLWKDVIARCLEYDAADRYQSAAEVARELGARPLIRLRIRRGHSIAISRGAAAISAAALLLLCLSTGLYLYYNWPFRPNPRAVPFYERGVLALHEGTYLEAARNLGMAVQLDNNFALAHAHLAEAWSELDFTGLAQDEMLLAAAPAHRRGLSQIDRTYIDAVRNTLVRDYSAAAQNYEQILRELPGSEKPRGYVDLGRAYEKAGMVKETLRSYEKAAEMRPDDPAPFVHLGIWKSRQRDNAGAEAAFRHAEMLYRTSSNLEGLAEVAYQRGYAANDAGESKEARRYLEQSLSIARQLGSPQLEVRSLTQLSSVEYNASSDKQAIEDANQAIQMARENGLEYWSTDGLMRLGNAYFNEGDYSTAENYLQQSLRLSKQYKHPRIEADCNFTLASIRQQQGKADEAIQYAKTSLKYLTDYGFASMAAQARIIIIRSDQAKGNLSEALREANDLLNDTQRNGNASDRPTAESTLGYVLLDMEEYPSALAHFNVALTSASPTDENIYYQLESADLFSRLGRYKAAEQSLSSIPDTVQSRLGIRPGIAITRLHMLLSEEQFGQALTLASTTLITNPQLPPSKRIDLMRVKAVAEAHMGQVTQAHIDIEQALSAAKNETGDDTEAATGCSAAGIYLLLQTPTRAINYAQSAIAYYRAKRLKDSLWPCLLTLAGAYKLIGDIPHSRDSALEAIDILKNMERNWDTNDFHDYISRYDYKSSLEQYSSFGLDGEALPREFGLKIRVRSIRPQRRTPWIESDFKHRTIPTP